MYAVIETGGKQYKVKEGATVFVEKIDAEPNTKVEFDKVLLVAGNGEPTIGTPYVTDAKVIGTLIDIIKDDKIIVYKFKRKTGYDKKQGHRQLLAQVKIESIELAGKKQKETAKKEEVKQEEQPKKTKAAQETQPEEQKKAAEKKTMQKKTAAKKAD